MKLNFAGSVLELRNSAPNWHSNGWGSRIRTPAPTGRSGATQERPERASASVLASSGVFWDSSHHDTLIQAALNGLLSVRPE